MTEELILSDPLMEWCLLETGEVVMTFTDTSKKCSIKYTFTVAVGQLAMALAEATETRKVFDSDGFDAACEYVSYVVNGPDYKPEEGDFDADAMNKLLDDEPEGD